MKTYRFTSVIWKEKEGYVSKCPELGVASVGDTVEEALQNLKEAVELYLENAKELGLLDEIEETKEKYSARDPYLYFGTSRLEQRKIYRATKSLKNKLPVTHFGVDPN